MFDVVRLAMNRAVGSLGSNDRTFNAAGFSQAVVEAMLCGRNDVEQLRGEAHYRLLG